MKISNLLMGVCLSLSAAFYSCTPSDAELQTHVNEKLQSNPTFAGITATVAEGTATLTGEVLNEEVKANAGKMVMGVSGIDSVTNQIDIAPPQVLPSQSLIKDDQMMEKAESILKDYPGVTASVSAGTITLTGSIDSTKVNKLLQELSTLNPVSINNQLNAGTAQ